MTIKNCTSFSYAGVDSSTYNILNVNYNVSFMEEYFLPSSEHYIIEMPGRSDPYFQGIKRQPLQLELSFAFDGDWTDYIEDVAQWLCPTNDYYAELIFSDQPNAVYFARYDGDISLLHNCNDQGLITLVMRCSSPYIYSTLNESAEYTPLDTITLDNEGHVELRPIIYLTINEDMDTFTLTNNTNEVVMQFEDLVAGDEIIVDTENEIITATNSGVEVYRYDNLVGDMMYMDVGENELEVSEVDKDWVMKFEYRFRWLKV